MHLTLPTDPQTQAEWWCALNGYETPKGVDQALTEAQCSEIMRELEKSPGVLQAGLDLWRARYDAGQDPATGEQYSMELLQRMRHPAAVRG